MTNPSVPPPPSSKPTVLKIGILAPRDLDFAPWEKRLFEKIASDPRFEITALIIDGRVTTSGQPFYKRILDAKLPQHLLSRLRTRLDESALGPEPPAETPAFDALLPNLLKIEAKPQRRRFVDIFSEADCVPVRELDLDVILRHAFGIIKGPILTSAKHGIWSFHHADNRVNRGGPPGFWETLNEAPVTGATLQILTPELDGGRVIARCFRSTAPNAARNQRAIYELSNSLLWRELQRLSRDGYVNSRPSTIYDGPLFVAPGLRDLLRYFKKRVMNLSGGVKHKIDKLLNRRPGMWTLAIGSGQIETATLWRTKEIPSPENRFWADPFLLEKNGTLYVLFEEYDYAINRAWISAGTIIDGKFNYLGKAVDAGYHMSFPFVMEHDSEIYMIPETAEKSRVEVWRAIDFPLRWKLHKTVLEETAIADTVLHQHAGQWYLLANICQTDDYDFCNELHVFMVDGPGLNSIRPHPENPVVIDSRTARNGGRMFYRNGKLFRPSQNNSNNIYGYGLNIMEVTELSPMRYREHLSCAAKPDFRPDIMALHHVDAVDDMFIIDMCKPVGGRGKPLQQS